MRLTLYPDVFEDPMQAGQVCALAGLSGSHWHMLSYISLVERDAKGIALQPEGP